MPYPRFLQGVADPLRRLKHWFSADVSEVVWVGPARGGSRGGGASAVGLVERAGGEPGVGGVGAVGGAVAGAAGGGGASLAEELAWWRRTLVRRWRAVVVRRALTAGLAVAVALLLVHVVLVALPAWLLVGAPLVVSAAACALAATAAPLGEARVARLLDQRLGLAERVGTAWELVGGGGVQGPLAQRVIADAERLVGEARTQTEVRARRVPGEWGALTGLAVACAALLVLGVAGGSTSGDEGSGGPVAQTRDGSASARRDATAQPSGATTPARTQPSSPTATTPQTGRGGAGEIGRTGMAGSAVGQTDTGMPQIAVRRQPGAQTGAGGGAGRSAGGATAGAGSGRDAAETGSGARRGSSSGVAAVPGSTPPPRQVQAFSAEGRRASAPVAAGAPTAGARGTSGDEARAGARSGTRGAGRQTGRLGDAGRQPRTSSGEGRLPLRTRATAGGRERGTTAGRATTDARGRGAARVQRGGAGAGSGGSGAAGSVAALSFVPFDVSAVPPALRELVAAYFPAP